MDLDLERFWAGVRSKARKPRTVVRQKFPESTEIWVEALDSNHRTPCTPQVRVKLVQDGAGFKCDVKFPPLTSSTEVNIYGVLVYVTSLGNSVYIPCPSQHLFEGDTLTLTLYISEGPTLTRLKQLGLKTSV